MVAITNIVLLATTAAALTIDVTKRTTAQIVSDLNAINSDVGSLASLINAYSSIANAPGLISSEHTLDTAIQKATTDVKATSGPVSEADANSIIAAIEALETNVEAAIKAIEAKKTIISSEGLAPVVLSDLKSLQTDTDALAAALLAIAPADKVSEGQQLKSIIDQGFTQVIAYYS